MVGSRFCLPHEVALTVTRRSAYAADGGFAVTDAAGAVVLRSEVELMSRFTRRAIVDAAGVPIVSMKRKVYKAATLICTI